MTVAFLALAFAPTALRSVWRVHTLLRLAPNAKRVQSALTHRLIVLALIASVPTIILRSVLSVKFGNSIDATVSIADVTFKNYALVTLYLAHVVALITIMFGLFKLSIQTASLPIMYGAVQWSSTGYFWLPLAACAAVVVGHFGRPKLEAWVGENPYWARRAAAKGKARPPWWIARLQQRAARAAAGSDGASLRIVALLAGEPRTLRMTLTGAVVIIYVALSAGFMNRIAVSWFLALPIAILLVQLRPLPLGRIMLLPLGVERARLGHIMTAVWARGLTSRMLIYSVLGIALHAFFWWLNWPAFIRSPFFSSADVATQLLWSPVAQSVGLYGMALSACLLYSASPRLHESSSFLRAGPFATVVLVAIVGVAFNWALHEWIPATNARNTRHITFAIVNGALLPACAWCVNRALRYQWATANLSAISAAMHASSVRSQNTFSPQ